MKRVAELQSRVLKFVRLTAVKAAEVERITGSLTI